jgi:hypothetical protein
MRGEHFHKNQLQQLDLFPTTATSGRGRNPELLQQRNEKMAYRYYYYAYLKQTRGWEYIVTMLSVEFDISTTTVSKTVTMVLSETLKDIFQQKPSVQDLKRKFPYLVW